MATSDADAILRSRMRRALDGILPRLTGSNTQVGRNMQLALDQTSSAELLHFAQRLRTVGRGYTYQPPDPVARRLTAILGDAVLTHSAVSGLEPLRALTGKPTMLLANHLSYPDANVLQELLARNGLSQMADRLTVVVGPKVFHRMVRRCASLCFGTIKIAQSPDRASGVALMPRKEIAAIARQTMGLVRERVEAGDLLLIFVEGTRSRDGALQPALSAVSRYFDGLDVSLVPVGIAGTDKFMEVGSPLVKAAPVRVAFGEPIHAEALTQLVGKGKKDRMDEMGRRIAQLLPEKHRGVYS